MRVTRKIEIDLDDFDDDDLIEELIYRNKTGEIEHIAEKLDSEADSWDFTRKMRDYFVAEMKKIEGGEK